VVLKIMQIHLFHTNDFHNKLALSGVERLRNAVSAIAPEPYLLLDAGDAIKAGNLGLSPSGEPILETMSEMGYHAMTMGNRETHPLLPAVRGKIGKARFPVLSANQTLQKGEGVPFQSHCFLQIGDVRVGVFGVTIPMVTARSKDRMFWDTLFHDPTPIAQKMVDLMRPECDLLIALTHIGFARDKELLESVLGIDVLIGGHSHTHLDEPVWVGSTPILQTGCFARAYGHGILERKENGWELGGYALHPLN
jgi:2',3'-cyclic-nucleotide 2'-phosphodiesterase (5'-nucleotidase family)